MYFKVYLKQNTRYPLNRVMLFVHWSLQTDDRSKARSLVGENSWNSRHRDIYVKLIGRRSSDVIGRSTAGGLWVMTHEGFPAAAQGYGVRWLENKCWRYGLEARVFATTSWLLFSFVLGHSIYLWNIKLFSDDVRWSVKQLLRYDPLF